MSLKSCKKLSEVDTYDCEGGDCDDLSSVIEKALQSNPCDEGKVTMLNLRK